MIPNINLIYSDIYMRKSRVDDRLMRFWPGKSKLLVNQPGRKRPIYQFLPGRVKGREW